MFSLMDAEQRNKAELYAQRNAGAVFSSTFGSKQMNNRVLMAMSGGVDSSVAALPY